MGLEPEDITLAHVITKKSEVIQISDIRFAFLCFSKFSGLRHEINSSVKLCQVIRLFKHFYSDLTGDSMHAALSPLTPLPLYTGCSV